MIVRIASEGQYKIASAVLDELNEFDSRLIQVVASGDGAAFGKVLGDMLTLVRTKGTPVAAEELVASDVILPAPDVTIDEARHLFTGDGLIPG
jgi:hypothetical protein